MISFELKYTSIPGRAFLLYISISCFLYLSQIGKKKGYDRYIKGSMEKNNGMRKNSGVTGRRKFTKKERKVKKE